jgi:hypothetical protein
MGVDFAALTPTRLAVLDFAFACRMARWPYVAAGVIARSVLRSRRLQYQAAVRALPRIDDRILLMLWHYGRALRHRPARWRGAGGGRPCGGAARASGGAGAVGRRVGAVTAQAAGASAAGAMEVDSGLLAELAAMRRESASDGSGAAAARIARELEQAGADVRLEVEWVHGTYWVPLGILAAATACAALLPRRGAAPVAALCAAGVADELWVGRQWLRRLLRRRRAVNVVAELGPRDAARTIVVHAHHDAAHSGRIFDARIPRALAGLAPRLAQRLRTTPPLLWPALGAPLAVLAGSARGSARLRRAGGVGALGVLMTMADIARAPVVPGACDNLSGVVALIALGRRLAERPPQARVVLLSTDSEESFLEGMQAFLDRHADRLDPERTTFLCLESVGSERLVVLGGEGFLRLHRYPAEPAATLVRCAREASFEVERGFRFRFATDGQLPLLRGYPAAVLSSIDWYRAPRNYHWPTDDAEHVAADTAGAAAETMFRAIHALASA